MGVFAALLCLFDWQARLNKSIATLATSGTAAVRRNVFNSDRDKNDDKHSAGQQHAKQIA